jgi:hypothetical protein
MTVLTYRWLTGGNQSEETTDTLYRSKNGLSSPKSPLG